MSGEAVSFSRIRFTLTVQGKGACAGELVRHLAPFTVRTIVRAGRVQGVLTSDRCGLVLLAGMDSGAEKTKKEFSRGDVAYLPLDGSIHIFTKDCSTSRPMNHLGAVQEGLDVLDLAKPGDRASLEASA